MVGHQVLVLIIGVRVPVPQPRDNVVFWYYKFMTREEVKKLIDTYGRAWETKDPDLAVSIFTEDATYDDPHEPLNSGKKPFVSTG